MQILDRLGLLPRRLADGEESLFCQFAIRSLGGFILYLPAFWQALQAGLPMRRPFGGNLAHRAIDIPAVHAIVFNCIYIGLGDAGSCLIIMRATTEKHFIER